MFRSKLWILIIGFLIGWKIMPEGIPEIQATRIFYENLNSVAPVVLNKGGARSSKSHSVHQLFNYRFFTQQHKKFLVIRKTLPSLKLSTLTKFKEVCWEFGINPELLRSEKQMLNYYYGTNLLHFGSVDDPEKIKSTEWNYVLMEEATEFDKADFRICKLRMSAPIKDGAPNQMFLLFNPVDEYHWIKTDIIDKDPDIQVIHSTYKDNPFLSAAYIKELEKLEQQDPNFYRIYTRGEWGRLENIIYTEGVNWYIVNEAPLAYDEVFYGLDLGFNSETALIECGIKEDELFARELLYQTELTPTDLIKKLDDIIPNKSDPMYCDPHEPATIEELCRAGYNAIAALTGPGSVKAGIDFVKKKKVRVIRGFDTCSEDFIKELRSYSWQVDRLDHPIDVPVKFTYHLMDAWRMAIHSHIGEGMGDVDIWVI